MLFTAVCVFLVILNNRDLKASQSLIAPLVIDLKMIIPVLIIASLVVLVIITPIIFRILNIHFLTIKSLNLVLCNGYVQYQCQEGEIAHCPEKGTPFCCRGTILNDTCCEGAVCKNTCYSRCSSSLNFICDENFGGFCCGIDEELSLDNTKTQKICCNKKYICNNLCYTPCDKDLLFLCDKKDGGLCCQRGENLALGADDKKMCCDINSICNDRCYSRCSSGLKFVCDPIKGGVCTFN
jgi:hypothetical protein